MKNIRNRILLFFRIIIIGFIIFMIHYMSNELDSIFLLEKSNPLYWCLLSESCDNSIKYIENNSNVLINCCEIEKTYDQFKLITEKNGSIKYSGYNNGGDKAIQISPDFFCLDEGEYVLSDGLKNKNFEIYLYIEGWKYENGEIKKKVIASSLGDGIFCVKKNEYDCYWYGLHVADNFFNNELTIYPMIREVKDENSEYEPCIVMNNCEDVSEYSLYSVPKNLIHKIGYKDWSIFFNSIRNYKRRECDYTVLEFEDGTGIEFKRNSLDDVVYGKLGRNKKVKNWLADVVINDRTVSLSTVKSECLSEEGINGIDTENNNEQIDISEIYCISDYLEKILNTNYYVLISVKDNASNDLPDGLFYDLKQIGITKQLDDAYRKSYVVVIKNKKIVFEKISDDLIKYTLKFKNGTLGELMSAGHGVGNVASININGSEYAKNISGLNIVIYDADSGEVKDSVAYNCAMGLNIVR